MTLLIAHRGLTNGSDPLLENNPEQINKALSQGYDCEVDIWFVDNNWYLGHDGPTYQVTDEFVHQSGFWIHAKNLAALHRLTATNLIYFWHQEDDFTLTSNGYIWTYPKKTLTDRSICVMPESFMNLEQVKELNCHGICSDYINKIKSLA